MRYEEIHFNKHLFREKQPLLSSRADDPYYTPMKEEVTDTLSFALHLLQVYFNSHKGLFLLNGVLALLLIAWLFSINSVFTVITAMALKLSVDILVELTYMMYIRLQHHRLVNAAHSFTNTRHTARRILAGFAIMVWLMVFARTANIYDALLNHLFG